MVLYWRRYGRVGGCQNLGGIAQLGERLPCKQEVTSSNLVISIWEIILYFFSDDCTLKTTHWINDEIDCKRSISQTSECVKIGYENNILIKIEKIILNNKCLGANEKNSYKWGKTRPATHATVAIHRKMYKRLSEEERRVDALALRAEEGRDKLRKALVRSKYPMIQRYPNGET